MRFRGPLVKLNNVEPLGTDPWDGRRAGQSDVSAVPEERGTGKAWAGEGSPMEARGAILEGDLVVRRVRAGDAERVADFVNGALEGRVSIELRTVIARLGEVAFLVAEESNVMLGLLGWHVENLVACVTDLLIWPARERARVGPALVNEMETQAGELQAEVALLFLPRSRFAELMPFCESFGYTVHRVGELPRAWREMAYEAGLEDEHEMPVKELRSDRVFRPL